MNQKTRMAAFFLILGLMALGSPAFAQTLSKEHPLQKEIEKIIFFDTGIRFELVPGIIIGIIDGDSSYIVSLGSRSFTDSSKLTADDIFEVGSIAKIMTATAIRQLEQKNALSTEATVAELTGDLYAKSNIGHLTINALIHHQTGLPKYPAYIGQVESNIEQPFSEYSRDHLNVFLRGVKRPQLKGDFLYSHINYAVLEIILEQHLKMTFPALMRQILFDPIGMFQTGFEAVDQKITPGFTLAGKPSEVRSFASFSAAEGLHSTMTDLMKFLRWVMIEENAHIWKNENPGKIRKKKIRQVNGWFVDQQGKKHSMYIHSGKSNGHHALMGFVGETQTGVIVLANSAHGTQDLGPLILRMLNQNWKRKPE